MPKKIFVIFFLIFSCLASSVFAEYTELVGKVAEIHGPNHWQKLGVALNKKRCDDLIYSSRNRDKETFTAVLKSYDVLRVEKNTKVFVQDVELFKNRAHVIIESGMYKGMSGWIPIEWLDGNDTRHLFKDKREDNKI